MTPLGNNQFVWDFDASGFEAGSYEIDVFDPIWKMDGCDRTVALNVTGEPLSPGADAVKVFAPTFTPSVAVTCASPLALVAV